MPVLSALDRAAPRVVAIGGSTRPGSTTEQLLRMVVADIHPEAEISMFCGPDLLLPHYAPGMLGAPGHELVEAVRRADVVLVGSPGYHGSLSGTVKNALDYLEELADDEHAYLDGKVVGCVATAYGWQAAVNTLGALRPIVAALRGWCAPYGIAVNVTDNYLDASGSLRADRLAGQIDILTSQIREFLRMSGRIAVQPA
ncbi:MAG: putative flavoprotein [Gemmatimonadales bacterium]|jgi:FMN reductase|nr:putative flavoprotein [Gemmatimonadales bacterium]